MIRSHVDRAFLNVSYVHIISRFIFSYFVMDISISFLLLTKDKSILSIGDFN